MCVCKIYFKRIHIYIVNIRVAHYKLLPQPGRPWESFLKLLSRTIRSFFVQYRNLIQYPSKYGMMQSQASYSVIYFAHAFIFKSYFDLRLHLNNCR